VAGPISLERAKKALAITSAHRDEEITDKLAAAQWHVEDYTGLILNRRTVTEVLDYFEPRGVISLTKAWPVISVDEIAFLGVEEEPLTLEGARYRLAARPARIFAPTNGWPETADPAEIVIKVTAGYDEALAPDHAEAIPPPLITAMLLLTGHWLENRETVVVGTIASDLPHGWMGLCRPYRLLL
jgi:uncharacterized phiE125 gp8 family phage protein